MKLAVISHTEHYLDAAGQVHGWAATVRELSRLAPLFDEVVHLAPLHPGSPPASAAPYTSPRLELRPLRPTGGAGLVAKWGIVRYLPTLWRQIDQVCGEADLIHVRAPANIALTALIYLDVRRISKPCWVKYAGNWRPDPASDYFSYRLQRRRLSVPRPWRAVTVNGRWPGDGAHVHAFLNPCLTDDEWQTAKEAAASKPFTGALQLLFVGRLDEQKGGMRAVRIARRLQERGLDVQLTVAGDGAEADAVRAAAEGGDGIRWVGWRSRSELDELYAAAHFLLLPSRAEGWPKVLSEAMAHGALPVAGDVSAIGQILQDLQATSEGNEAIGWVLPPGDEEEFVQLIQALWRDDPSTRAARARTASEAAGAFTYRKHVERVRTLFADLGARPDG